MGKTNTAGLFTARESIAFSFVAVPKALLSEERYRHIAIEAKVLYGYLLNRMSLSAENGWVEENGTVFVYFPLEEITELFCVAYQKAQKIRTDLVRAGLAVMKVQGQGRPSKIFPVKFWETEGENATG